MVMQQHLNRKPAESAESPSHLQLSHSKYGGDESSVQRMSAYSAIANSPAPIQRQAAPQGGLPANLKGGIESLSGIAMDDVRVHYNSSKPAQLQAHAYAQGTDIHIAPGQERHLPHEAWHVVQQKQGRVKPTLQLKGVAINDDSALEREADVMGGRAMGGGQFHPNLHQTHLPQTNSTLQRQGITGSGNLVTQRLQLVAAEADEIEDDLTIINNIVFARAINKERGVPRELAGSLFGNYSANSIDWDHNEIIFVHGHGLKGGFSKYLSQGIVKEEKEDKGIFTWKQTAELIANRMKIGNIPKGKKLEIRMLSCHGAEPTGDVGQAETMKSRGFHEEMAEALAKNSLQGSATAFNDPAISWIGLLPDTYHEDEEEMKRNQSAKESWDDLLKFLLGKLTEEWKLEIKETTTYQERMDIARKLLTKYDIPDRIAHGATIGAIRKSEPQVAETKIIMDT